MNISTAERDNVVFTPLRDDKLMISTPRSSIAGYNLRPAELLKRRLSPGKLKFACASTPRRKSTRPKGFLSAKKLETRRVIVGLEMEDLRDSNGNEVDDEKDVMKQIDHGISDRFCTSGESQFERTAHAETGECPKDLILRNEKQTRLSIASTASSPYTVSSCVTETTSLSLELDERILDGKNGKSTAAQNRSELSCEEDANNSGQVDAFSTPGLGTSTLNTTFTKNEDETQCDQGTDETQIDANINHIKQEQDENVSSRRDGGRNNSHRCSKRETNKENKVLPLMRSPELNAKKVEFSIKDLMSTNDNPEDIKLYAQIRQEFFPLKVSKTKLDLLLSSDNSPTPINTPHKTPVLSKIPRSTFSQSKKSILKSSASSTNGNQTGKVNLWLAPRPFQLQRTTISTTHVERRYRRHTLSSAAKVKQSHLVPATSASTADVVPEALPTSRKSAIPTKRFKW